jgi:hypothetical protein
VFITVSSGVRGGIVLDYVRRPEIHGSNMVLSCADPVGELVPIVADLPAIRLIIFAIPICFIYQSLSLPDTRFGLALTLCIVNLALVLILLINGIRAMPVEIEEAAHVDGAGVLAVVSKLFCRSRRARWRPAPSFIHSWSESLIIADDPARCSGLPLSFSFRRAAAARFASPSP